MKKNKKWKFSKPKKFHKKPLKNIKFFLINNSITLFWNFEKMCYSKKCVIWTEKKKDQFESH